MNQRAYLGTSYLDIAKGAVEIFMKVSAGPGGPPPPPRLPPSPAHAAYSALSPQLRARDPASRGDRYMLVTFDEPPYCIKVIPPLTPPPPPSFAAPAGSLRPPRPRGGAARCVATARLRRVRPGGGSSSLWRWRTFCFCMEERGWGRCWDGGGGGRRRTGAWFTAPACRGRRVAGRAPPPRPMLARLPWGGGLGGARASQPPSAAGPAPLAAVFTPSQRRARPGRAARARAGSSALLTSVGPSPGSGGRG